MKALLAIAFIFLSATTVVKASGFETFMYYEIMTEGFMHNITQQLRNENASICVNNTHRIIDEFMGYIGGGGILSYLIHTRNLFMHFIRAIDYCPYMVPIFKKFIEVFKPMVTDPYHFIWKLANNVAVNGIDIYYHIGWAVRTMHGLVGHRDTYFHAGTIFGDIMYDIFFSS